MIEITDLQDRLPPDWQAKSEAQSAFLDSPADVTLFGGAAGGGKHLRLDELLPTPTGWVENGALALGDALFAEDGSITHVTELFPTVVPIKAYKLTFDDGTEIEAGADHLWRTFDIKELAALTRLDPEWRARRRAKRKSRVTGARSAEYTAKLTARNKANAPPTKLPPAGSVRTTEEIYQTRHTPSGRVSHAIPVAAPLQLPAQQLPIDPYILGAWLGDGNSASAGYTSADQFLVDQFTATGFVIETREPRYHFYVKGLFTLLNKAGLISNKHIPAQYLRASYEQRLALVQGLMDTDGTADLVGSVSFTNTNKRIIDGLHELILSLGWKAAVCEGIAKLYGREIGPVWTISWTPSEYVFRLPRKRDRQRLAIRRTTKFRYIIACEPVEPSPMRCIRVDSPSHLFLCSRSMIPTHNSEVILVDAAAMYDAEAYHAVIFRRTFPELQQLMDRSKELYSNLGGTFNISEKIWRWPWGSTIEFKYLEKDDDIYKRQGFQWQYCAFDESTHFLQQQVRYIIQSRMRSPEGYRIKVRLGTNPGNRGAPWHKKLFIGPKCPHCILKAGGKFPKTSRKPYQLYTDATWMDGVPLGLSTMFIPSKVTDHNIFGAQGGTYAKRLRGLPLAFQMALLEGCWDAFEGQYFDCFDYNCHTMKHQNIEKLMKPWWPKWVSIDYGFAHATVAYLWTMDPEGHVYTLSEYVIHRRKATDVALDLQKLWGDHRIKAWYLSPDAFRHDGTDDFSRAEMMSRATGIGFDEAYNERISGAMLMYQLLQDFKWHISDSCELLIASIPSRIHDEEKKAEDVLKVDSEDEDDAYDSCLISSTYIQTSRGPLPIVDVKPGMLVETRQGLKPVLHSWKTGHKPCCNVAFSNGVVLTGTGNHPTWVPEKGFVRLDSLRYGDTILSWQDQKLSSLMASSSDATQIRHIAASESTSILAEPTASEVYKPFIRRFGRLITGLSQRATTFITRITIRSITNPITSWLSPSSITSVNMEKSVALTWNTWPGSGPLLWHGIGQPRAGNGMQHIAKRLMPSEKPQSLTAVAAGACSILSTDSKSLDSALTPVSQPSGVLQVWTTLKRYVKAALQLLRPTGTRRLDSAPDTVLSVRDAGSHDVYNLEVEGANEYFANGILVHNCRYGIASHINPGKRPDSEELQAKITSDEPTTAMMQYNMALAAMAKKQQPLFYRRGARSR